jgi:hypothetical protein
MTTHRRSPQQPDPLDALTEQLLECGAVLSQIISHMVQFDAAGRSAPDAAPIPDVARGLIRDVIEGLGSRHSAAEISTAAALVGEATEAISTDIFFVSPDMN